MVCSILFNLLPQLVVFNNYTYYYILVLLVCQFLQTQISSVYEIIVEFDLYTFVVCGNETKFGGSENYTP